MDVQRLADRTPRRAEREGREAAVLVPIIQRDDPGAHLLFTKRSDRLPDHPGQMSFPGGGREPGDPDLRTTALREANEEIGLPADAATPIGRLDDIHTTSEYVVAAYVAEIPDLRYEPDGREVAEIVVLPLAEFLVADNYERTRHTDPDRDARWIHYFHVGGYTVWGATGRLVAQLLELTTDWQPDGH